MPFMNRIWIICLLTCCLAQPSFAQVRYLDAVFPEVQLEQAVEYGQNTSVLQALLPPIKVPLLMDVYQPLGDTLTGRPLAILVHSGNFIPAQLNGTHLGSRQDSAMVYLATQLARRGYVVAAIDHRLGWNPISPDPVVRRFTLTNALYRGIQDLNTCARFFHKNEDAYGIDPEKLLVWGDGSGGLLAFSTASLVSFEEWLLPQFILPGNPVLTLMVNEAINGDLWATSTGVVTADYPFYQEGDTLCHPNHVGYEAAFKLAISMNGGVVDTSWIDAGEATFIAFHALPDPFMPYDFCGTNAPPPALPLPIDVCGSLRAVDRALGMGNNDVFAGLSFPSDFSEVANARNGGVDGLFPLYAIELSAWEIAYPWQWWDETLGPNATTAAAARLQLDTMLAYVAPRACLALGLNCPGIANTAEPAAPRAMLQLFPNPTHSELTIRWENGSAAPGDLEIRALDGRLMLRHATAGTDAQLDVSSLPPGAYFVRWRIGGQVAQVKFVRR